MKIFIIDTISAATDMCDISNGLQEKDLTLDIQKE